MKSDAYKIRSARAEDADAVARLWHMMAEQHRAYDAQVWCWSADAPQRWREMFLGALDNEDMILLVAEEPKGELVGFSVARAKDSAAIFATSRLGEVWDLAVKPEHRRRGAARRLMAVTFERLRARGCDDVILHVALANEPATAFYKRLGMRAVMNRFYMHL